MDPLPPKNGTELRRFPRYCMALDLAFGPAVGEAGRPPDHELKRTVSVNISVGGLCLHSDAVYPVGSQLFCSIALPGRAAPVEVIGVVAWFEKLHQQIHGYRIGLEFSKISSEDAAALQDLFEHPPAAHSPRAKKLLLADDDQELQLAIKLRLESVGFQVITASEGLEALQKGRQEQPHLIILDLMLPRLSGFEVCRLLKFDQKFRHIPILIFTARSRREDLQLIETIGADACLMKPCEGKILIARVEALLNEREVPS